MLRRPVSPRLKERFFHKKIYKKNVSPQHIKKTIFGYTINMSNPQQNNIHNEIKQIKKETDSLQDRLKKNDKSQNQFEIGLMPIGIIQVQKGQRTHVFQTKKLQNIVKNIF